MSSSILQVTVPARAVQLCSLADPNVCAGVTVERRTDVACVCGTAEALFDVLEQVRAFPREVRLGIDDARLCAAVEAAIVNVTS
jgi:hypothetical protein